MKTIKKKQFLGSLFLVFFLFGLGTAVMADTREENIDLFIVLDKSLSMEEEIDAVKEYVQESLVGKVLIPGDFVAIIQFYGKAEVLVAKTVESEQDIQNYIQKVENIYADGSYTDIGNALDVLQQALDEYHREDNREYLLLLTDGVQEAPPDSKYYTEDGSFNHAFLENARTIQKAGWKIQVLGIGMDTAAKKIAEELAGGYAETSDSPTKEELTEKTEELLSALEISGPAELEPVTYTGDSALNITLESTGFSVPPTVSIEQIVLTIPELGREYTLAEDVRIEIREDGTTDVSLPVRFENTPEPGAYSADIRFVFGGLEVFTPGIVETEVRFKGFLGSNIWIIPVGAVVLAGLVLGLLLLFRGAAKNRAITIRVFIDNKSVGSGSFPLKQGDELFIIPDKTSFDVVKDEKPETAAVLYREQDALKIKIRDKKVFRAADPLPENLLGKKVRIKLQSGLYRTFMFKAV